MDSPPRKVVQGELYSQAIHVTCRNAHSNQKTSVVRSSTHEAYPMAPEVTLARPRGFRKDHPCSSVTSPPPRLVVGRRHCPTLAPPSTHSSAVYRRLKRRLGLGLHCKRRFVTPRKSLPHKFLGVKSSPSGPQDFRAFLQGPDCSCSNGQHNCSLLHQGGMRSGSLCTLLWRLLSSCHPRGISLRA